MSALWKNVYSLIRFFGGRKIEYLFSRAGPYKPVSKGNYKKKIKAIHIREFYTGKR